MKAEPGIILVGQEPRPLTPAHRKAAQTPKRMRSGNHRKGRDRFSVLNAFVDGGMAGLSRAEALTWLVLYRDTRPDGLARTGQSDIARRIGTSDRTVRRALTRLQSLGLIRITWRGRIGSGPSAYRVTPLPKAAL